MTDDDVSPPSTDAVALGRLLPALVAALERQEPWVTDQLHAALANDDLRFRVDDTDGGPLLVVVVDGRALVSVPLEALIAGT